MDMDNDNFSSTSEFFYFFYNFYWIITTDVIILQEYPGYSANSPVSIMISYSLRKFIIIQLIVIHIHTRSRKSSIIL